MWGWAVPGGSSCENPQPLALREPHTSRELRAPVALLQVTNLGRISHRAPACLGWKGPKLILFSPAARGQGHFPLEQAAQKGGIQCETESSGFLQFTPELGKIPTLDGHPVIPAALGSVCLSPCVSAVAP